MMLRCTPYTKQAPEGRLPWPVLRARYNNFVTFFRFEYLSLMPRALVLIAVCILSATLAAPQSDYPKPQVASAVGKPAPDFSLKDQNGSTLNLSDQRGSWVLLYFYRGYW